MARWITNVPAALCAFALGCASVASSGAPPSERPPEPAPEAEREPGAEDAATAELACRQRIATGLEHLRANRTEAAERTLRAAVRADRGCIAAYLDLAVVLRQRGDLDGALLELRRALARDATNVHALHQMILVHLARGDARGLDLAALTCRQGLQITEDWAPLHNTCGIVDTNRGHVVEGLARFERAFTLDPTLVEAWMNFGQITLSFRGYDDAERAFRRALELAPADYDAHIGLGIALRGQGRIDEAHRQYRRAVAIAPGRPEAFYNLGILSQEHRDGTAQELRRAGDLFETFVTRASDDEAYREQVADVRRCCPSTGGRNGHCRPGRLQIIRQSLRALGHEVPPAC